jgi:hypothetical protein
MAGEAGLVGTWRLLSWVIEYPDGSVSYPLGPDVAGQLTYTAGGHMSVHVMRCDRPVFPAGDFLSGAPEEIAALFYGYVEYAGTYELVPAEQAVIHHPVCSLFPQWIGSAQKRYVELDGDRLALLTPTPLPTGGQQLARLVWERLE